MNAMAVATVVAISGSARGASRIGFIHGKANLTALSNGQRYGRTEDLRRYAGDAFPEIWEKCHYSDFVSK